MKLFNAIQFKMYIIQFILLRKYTLWIIFILRIYFQYFLINIIFKQF